MVILVLIYGSNITNFYIKVVSYLFGELVSLSNLMRRIEHYYEKYKSCSRLHRWY
ncbi:hypothetical protein THF5H11_10366 [Vibrio jasicida]|nr:hypothetical protein THF5H11_10366 [Vibrio jasicida]CAH1607520.1 hypothetical protein THF5G08_40280 [Vibrio jasicida]